MKLSDLQLPSVSQQKRRTRVEIRDQKTRQTVAVESDDPLTGYHLDVDDADWEEGEPHPDGVIVGIVDDTVWVCFIELKGTLAAKEGKEDPSDKAFRQLEGGVSRFHPHPDSVGEAHHRAWRVGTDRLDLLPAKDHRVVGVAVAYRHVPRPAPHKPLRIGRTLVPLKVVALHGNVANLATIEFRQLLVSAGLL
ncbi:MAG: hypothetical protein JNM69_05145 [Archangium sp.]|nr:hypothetical protein [Archangium sp.]